MAQLDKQAIQTLVQLSRIECNEAEQEALLKDLGEILSYIEQLQEVDTANVSPRNQILEGVVNVMQEDIIGETMPRDAFLANAPSQIGGMIRVPPVMKAT